jgi:hypothetical protein
MKPVNQPVTPIPRIMNQALDGPNKMRPVGTTRPFWRLAAMGEVEGAEEDAEVGDDAGDDS